MDFLKDLNNIATAFIRKETFQIGDFEIEIKLITAEEEIEIRKNTKDENDIMVGTRAIRIERIARSLCSINKNVIDYKKLSKEDFESMKLSLKQWPDKLVDRVNEKILQMSDLLDKELNIALKIDPNLSTERMSDLLSVFTSENGLLSNIRENIEQSIESSADTPENPVV
ncbi:MAG: hypothetical protein WC783_00670 [Candidatus Paceibacterota bacterium]|jgi:hypothetical protein